MISLRQNSFGNLIIYLFKYYYIWVIRPILGAHGLRAWESSVSHGEFISWVMLLQISWWFKVFEAASSLCSCVNPCTATLERPASLENGSSAHKLPVYFQFIHSQMQMYIKHYHFGRLPAAMGAIYRSGWAKNSWGPHLLVLFVSEVSQCGVVWGCALIFAYSQDNEERLGQLWVWRWPCDSVWWTSCGW